MNKKMEEVREASIRVVSEDFLRDVSDSTRSLQDLLSAHVLAPWGAEVKAEPAEPAASRAKSGAALSKKSKGPVKEEGEALGPCAPGTLWPRLPRSLLANRPFTLPCTPPLRSGFISLKHFRFLSPFKASINLRRE